MNTSPFLNPWKFGTTFISLWDSTKTGTVATASNQVALPLIAGQVIDITVDWGDGNVEDIISSDDPALIHTYSTGGVYTIKINRNNGVGGIGWSFNHCPNTHKDKSKILDISQFGNVKISQTGTASSFRTFWQCNNLDITATDFYERCISITNDFNEMFRSCSSMTTWYDIENWDMSHVTGFERMFESISSFNKDITAWDVSNATTLEGMFNNCTAFNQNVNLWTVNANNISVTFNNCPNFNQNLSNWTHQFTNMSNTFAQCTSFEGNGLNTWDTSLNSSFSNTFNNCHSLNASAIAAIEAWDTGNATTFFRMFLSATPSALATADFSGWDVSKASNLADVFGISSFAGSVAGWTLKATTPVDCNNMFRSCVNFNGSLNGWTNTSSITNTSSMFLSCSNYNQPMNNWTLTNCTTMSGMFSGCISFNSALFPPPPAITGSLSSIFSGCHVFNQDVTGWDVSNITNFTSAFANARVFNQNISTWVTTSATNMRTMFSDAYVFNQPIGGWDVDQVGDFAYMFNRSTGSGAFDQDISTWVITSATDFTNFLNNQTLSTANYDALLIAWNALPPPSGLGANMGNATYTATVVDSGTTDGTATNKLIDSTQNFLTTVSIGDIVRKNATTYSKVTAVDSDTQLSIENDNIVSGDAYTIESSSAAKARYSMIQTYNWTIGDGGPI